MTGPSSPSATLPPRTKTTLYQITRDPFKPWKTSKRVLREGRKRGFWVVVAVDDRTSPDDIARLEGLADEVIPFASEGHAEGAFNLCTSGEFVLRIDDDEVPSENLWRFAASPPFEARYGIPVIPVINGRVYSLDVGIQERLFARRGWKWTGGFEGRSEGARQLVMESNPGIVIWHYHLLAPREEREAKAAGYALLDPKTDHRRRVIWEEHPEALGPLPEGLEPC